LNSRVGIVVPTLGTRPDYLLQCLRSIRAAGETHILLVAPANYNPAALVEAGLIDGKVDDPRLGLSEAINAGIRSLPPEVEFVNWLGDDDLLAEDSIFLSEKFLSENPEIVMVFGACDYIDSEGTVIWTNKSGPWAVPLLRFGPDLIPQPGALFRRDAFNRVGGLKAQFNWAFDFDLFIALSKLGKLKYLRATLSCFRWHPESLSVEHRKTSVSEASAVRVGHLPIWLRPASMLWEYPVKQATLWAGTRVTHKARKTGASK
jgi:GT2 family glycosyltransferase